MFRQCSIAYSCLAIYRTSLQNFILTELPSSIFWRRKCRLDDRFKVQHYLIRIDVSSSSEFEREEDQKEDSRFSRQAGSQSNEILSPDACHVRAAATDIYKYEDYVKAMLPPVSLPGRTRSSRNILTEYVRGQATARTPRPRCVSRCCIPPWCITRLIPLTRAAIVSPSHGSLD